MRPIQPSQSPLPDRQLDRLNAALDLLIEYLLEVYMESAELSRSHDDSHFGNKSEVHVHNRRSLLIMKQKTNYERLFVPHRSYQFSWGGSSSASRSARRMRRPLPDFRL